MQRVELDLHQDDCPLTRVSADYDVEITTPHWQLNVDTGRWDLRVRVTADAGDGELEAALRTLRDAGEMREFRLYAKRDGAAFARTVFDETTAIDVISRHGGFVVGPFDNVDGRERWRLGFDEKRAADEALSELDRHESFTVRTHRRLDPLAGSSDATGGVDAVPSGAAEETDGAVGAHRAGASERFRLTATLTETERRVLRVASARGYFESPRETTLAELGARLNVSDVAVSKTLRRAERKLVDTALAALDDGRPSE